MRFAQLARLGGVMRRIRVYSPLPVPIMLARTATNFASPIVCCDGCPAFRDDLAHPMRVGPAESTAWAPENHTIGRTTHTRGRSCIRKLQYKPCIPACICIILHLHSSTHLLNIMTTVTSDFLWLQCVPVVDKDRQFLIFDPVWMGTKRFDTVSATGFN